MASRLSYEHMQHVEPVALVQAGSSGHAMREARLFGLCEVFKAVDALQECAARHGTRNSGGYQDGAGECASGNLAIKDGALGTGFVDAAAALRASHVKLYYRSALATEAGDWQVLAALGEFYRLIGCPEPLLRAPVPDVATAVSYFEQAHVMQAGDPFIWDRLARLNPSTMPEDP